MDLYLSSGSLKGGGVDGTGFLGDLHRESHQSSKQL